MLWVSLSYHTGAVDGHSTLRRATGASVSYFDAPEPIPAPRSVRAAHGTYILRVHPPAPAAGHSTLVRILLSLGVDANRLTSSG